MGKREKGAGWMTAVRMQERRRRAFSAVFLKLLRCALYMTGSFALSAWFSSLFELGIAAEFLAVSTLLLGCWYFFVFLTRKTRLIGIPVSAAVLAAAAFVLRQPLSQGICEILNTASQYILDYYNRPLGFLPAAEDPDAIWITVLLLQALLMLLLGRSAFKGKSLGLFLAGLLLLSTGLMVNRFPSEEPVFLWLFACFSMRAAGEGREASGASSAGFRIGIIAAAAAVVLISWRVIAPRLNPVIESRYSAFREFQNELESGIRDLLGGRNSGGWQGMVQNGVLTNQSPSGEDDTALSLTVERKPEQTIYLKGFIGQLYQGSYWEEISDETFQSEMQELTAGAQMQETAEYWGYEELTYADLQTFLAERPYELQTAKNEETAEQFSIAYEDTPGDYVYAPYLSRVEEDSVQMSADVELLRNGGENIQGSFYPDLPEISADTGYTGSLYVPETIAYFQYLSDQYLYIPSSGLEQLQAYWNRVLEEFRSENGHDPSITETTHLIRSVLSFCSYSQDLEALPEGEDFVQYFLFEQKKGFCTHFASTAVLLYRMTGYPARYAAGYIARPGEFQEDESGSWTAEIPEKNAHAWVEIYQSDGSGWIPVEMTPGYEDMEDSAGATAEQQSTPSPAPMSGEVSDSSQGENGGADNSQIKVSVVRMPKPLWYGLTIFLVICLFLLLLMIRRLGILWSRNRRFQNPNARQALREIVREADRMLADSGFQAEEGISDQEYARRVQERYPALQKNRFVWLITQGEKASYGREKVPDGTAEEGIRIYHLLEREIRKGRGRWWKLWWYFIKCYR